jgi:hypothetical protein
VIFARRKSLLLVEFISSVAAVSIALEKLLLPLTSFLDKPIPGKRVVTLLRFRRVQ